MERVRGWVRVEKLKEFWERVNTGRKEGGVCFGEKDLEILKVLTGMNGRERERFFTTAKTCQCFRRHEPPSGVRVRAHSVPSAAHTFVMHLFSYQLYSKILH
jgi:hypothetical protein